MKYVRTDDSANSVFLDAADSEDSALLARDQRILTQAGIWLLRTTALASVMIAGFVLTSWGTKVWRVESSRQALASIGAETQWLHEHPPGPVVLRTTPKQYLAKFLGNAAVSDLGIVKVREGDPDDQALKCFGALKGVRHLELESNRATDQTLALVSRLPQLRYLTALGENFSIKGLLQLRDAPNLERLIIAANQYTAIELAVLQAALREVKIREATIQDQRAEPRYRHQLEETPLLADVSGSSSVPRS